MRWLLLALGVAFLVTSLVCLVKVGLAVAEQEAEIDRRNHND